MGATAEERARIKRDKAAGDEKEAKTKAKAKAEPKVQIEAKRGCWDDDGVKQMPGTQFMMSKTAAKKMITAGAAFIPVPDDD